MIIHSIFTNGYFPWAKLFLESFKFHNGSDYRVEFYTIGLTDKEIKELENIYPGICILNDPLEGCMYQYSWQSGIDIDTLYKYKEELETYHVTDKNKVLKMMIAADSRVGELQSIIEDGITEVIERPVCEPFPNGGHIVNFDIDLYVRKPLDELFDFIRQHDVSIRLRLDSEPNRKTMIGIQGYKFNQISNDFLCKWGEYLEAVHPTKRHKGYGQTSCWYAYEDFRDKLSWGDIPQKFISPKMKEEDYIWSANTSAGKTRNLEICRKDFKKCQTK